METDNGRKWGRQSQRGDTWGEGRKEKAGTDDEGGTETLTLSERLGEAWKRGQTVTERQRHTDKERQPRCGSGLGGGGRGRE